MSKRIDLTQFKGMSDNWEVVEQVVEAALRAVEPAVEYAIVTGRDNSSLDEANIIAKLPSLIAELKRCYEVIELLQGHYEDSEKRAAFHEEGLCDLLIFDCQYCDSK